MSKHFERDTERIHKQVIALFGKVEKMIDSAMRALCERELSLADEVFKRGRRSRCTTEVAIEEECLKVLALHQPVAIDLRRTITVTKINNDLERIADLACNIVERAQGLHQYAYFPIPNQLPGMAKVATEMLRKALDAFVTMDVELAKAVIVMDAEVDEGNLSVIEELKTLMMQDSSLVDPALHCFSASRHVERIGDLAENIAEDVVYLVQGDIVRHQHDFMVKGN